MFEVDWKIFAAKFSGKEQLEFENLCYHLFCIEYDKPWGIFRYKNQVGIETEPIEYSGKLIGFQAKYFETNLSSNVKEIKDSIDKAKRKNPSLSTIVFYTNKEFSESKTPNKKEPKYKINIEEYASAKKVEIDWRVSSHLEMQLAQESNRYIAKYFFSFEDSAYDLVKHLREHTESILKPIHCEISYQGNSIKLNRDTICKNLTNNWDKQSAIILYGSGGVGKTAIIKELYCQLFDSVPILVFRAKDFNNKADAIFEMFGKFKTSHFLDAYQGLEEKYAIIDSAERLSDIEDLESFIAFLHTLIENKWRIIFTTRTTFLDDIRYVLIEILKIPHIVLEIEKLTKQELESFSETYSFYVPKNEKLLDFLRIPFYLNLYLNNEKGTIGKDIDLISFRNILWNNYVKKAQYKTNNIHLRREKALISLVKNTIDKRSNYLRSESIDMEALYALEKDEIVIFHQKKQCFFINHDIYEEWALDIFIEKQYLNLPDYSRFFMELGESLIIRRAFRTWLSAKLENIDERIKLFIEHSLKEKNLNSFWKDEIIISILLSEYSTNFFSVFERYLLADEHVLLKRVIFLLRIACKKVDEALLKNLGLGEKVDSPLATIFVQPKGDGWISSIDFLHRNLDVLDIKSADYILPLLVDWTSKNNQGETTKKAGQLGLFYYDLFFKKNKKLYYSGTENEISNQIIKVIFKSAHEISEELKSLFEEFLDRNILLNQDEDYVLVKSLLTSLADNIEVIKRLPDLVAQIAKKVWIKTNKEKRIYSIDLEKEFGLFEATEQWYYPSSALQTPIYILLHFYPDKTIDFILNFVNEVVEHYYACTDDKVEKVTIFFDERQVVLQYLNDRLWNTYRGTKVSTYLLESIHMALEKWLLNYAEKASANDINNKCRYLIKNSISTSITSVVASVVMAYPNKLFDTAMILFRTKEFFFYDLRRLTDDLWARDMYSIGRGIDPLRDIHINERIEASKAKHRNKKLEDLVLRYQFIKTDAIDVDEVKRRQAQIWNLLDDYYLEIQNTEESNENQYYWKLCLARMDYRKMTINILETKEEVVIETNPQISSELERKRDDYLNVIDEKQKHMPLLTWANHRYKKDFNTAQQYKQYEESPSLALKEAQEISLVLTGEVSGDFRLLYLSVPVYVCAVLIRDFEDILNVDEIDFCRKTIIEFASAPLCLSGYWYQVGDGVEPAIDMLPTLLTGSARNNEEKSLVFLLLILLLFIPSKDIALLTAKAIQRDLWELAPEEANSIFIGYLYLKPRFDTCFYEYKNKSYEKENSEFDISKVIEQFIEKYETELQMLISNSLTYEDVINVKDIEPIILINATELLPLKPIHPNQNTFLMEITQVFSQILFQKDKYRNDVVLNYDIVRRFFEKFACFVLSSDINNVEALVKPFINEFSATNYTRLFITSFIYAEDKLKEYNAFWEIWYLMFDKIKLIYTQSQLYYKHDLNEIITSYLLAGQNWKKNITEWHSLREQDKAFYEKVCAEMGHLPVVLYSVAKVLNDIGSNYVQDGLFWLSNMIKDNKNLLEEQLPQGTLYYIENLIRKFMLSNRSQIESIPLLKDAVVTILTFIVEKGSSTGYLLRESVY